MSTRPHSQPKGAIPMHFQSLQYVVKTLDWCRPHNGQPPASPFSNGEFLSACKTEIPVVFLNNPKSVISRGKTQYPHCKKQVINKLYCISSKRLSTIQRNAPTGQRDNSPRHRLGQMRCRPIALKGQKHNPCFAFALSGRYLMFPRPTALP